MKTNFLGLRTAIYNVSDMEAAKAWYRNVFDTEPYFDQPFYIGFNIAGYELGLHPEAHSATAKSESVLTYWGVENVESEYKRMIALGATEHEKPTNVGGEIVVATVKDPWGNIIGIIYNPEFKLP
jgi:lactoylglutathione lyase